MSRFVAPISEERIFRKRGYIIGRLIGEGSYAKVYYAEHTDKETGQTSQLACKIVNSAKAPKEFVKKFFPREVDIISRIKHPHLILVHSVLQRRERYFMFMNYAENGDLLEYMRRNGVVPENQARIWFGQMVQGVEYLHRMDIAHRDLKCENMLLSSSLVLKIGDFGFARFCHDEQGEPILSTTYCGSISYASPEIIRGVPYDCKKADVWSLGIVLYIMLNKSMPFDDTNARKLLEKQMARDYRFRTKSILTVSQDAKTTVKELLNPDPHDRPHIEEAWEFSWMTLYLKEIEEERLRALEDIDSEDSDDEEEDEESEEEAEEEQVAHSSKKSLKSEHKYPILIQSSTKHNLQKPGEKRKSPEKFMVEGKSAEIVPQPPSQRRKSEVEAKAQERILTRERKQSRKSIQSKRSSVSKEKAKTSKVEVEEEKPPEQTEDSLEEVEASSGGPSELEAQSKDLEVYPKEFETSSEGSEMTKEVEVPSKDLEASSEEHEAISKELEGHPKESETSSEESEMTKEEKEEPQKLPEEEVVEKIPNKESETKETTFPVVTVDVKVSELISVGEYAKKPSTEFTAIPISVENLEMKPEPQIQLEEKVTKEPSKENDLTKIEPEPANEEEKQEDFPDDLNIKVVQAYSLVVSTSQYSLGTSPISNPNILFKSASCHF